MGNKAWPAAPLTDAIAALATAQGAATHSSRPLAMPGPRAPSSHLQCTQRRRPAAKLPNAISLAAPLAQS
eukprot:6492383-Amphidinium_carterae.1